ncbi:MAG: hypothetical protein JSU73_09500 [candidate division WOR-3 bacterium]|nr:MAG: hypothetical protein JSU73_09500 [candidate division WOR-3 bacterium]
MDGHDARSRTPLALLLVAIGGHGIATQVVLLRELMAISAGSEVSAGIGLGIWIAAEATGALLASRIPEERTEFLLHWLAAASAIAAPLGVLAVILGPSLLGVLPGEGIDIPRVAVIALVSGAIPAMTHGTLFVLGLVALGVRGKSLVNLGPGYVWEGLGTAAAAALTWLLLLPRFDSIALVALFGIPVVLVSGAEYPLRSPGRRLNPGLLAAVGVVALLAVVIWRSNDIVRFAWTRSWQGQRVTAVENSAYGKVVRLERSSQRLLLYDGSTAVSEPESDPALVEQLALVPLLVHPRPKHALVVGPGFGLVTTLANSPLKSVTLVQIDPVLQREALHTAGPSAAAALRHPKVRSMTGDPRLFLTNNVRRFDCIFISGEAPANLAANRLFTREFFAICRANLAGDGILATSGPGSPGQIGREARMALDTRTAGLEATFPHTRLILLDFPLLLASNSALEVQAETLVQKLRTWTTQPATLRPDYLAGLVDVSRQELLSADLVSHRQYSEVGVNTDLRPVEVFLTLLRESRLRSPWFADIYQATARTNPAHLLIAAVVLLIATALGSAKSRYRFADPLSISSSGFAGGAISTIALFAYQSRFGSIFAEIGLLLAAFMVGAVLGGWAGTRTADRQERRASVFLTAETSLLLASGTLVFVARQGPGFLFLMIQLVAGAAVGAQFPIACARLSGASAGSRAGRVAALDLAGGFLGAVVSAIFTLPAWGTTAAVTVVACLKLASLLGQSLAGTGLGDAKTHSV